MTIFHVYAIFKFKFRKENSIVKDQKLQTLMPAQKKPRSSQPNFTNAKRRDL